MDGAAASAGITYAGNWKMKKFESKLEVIS